MAVECKAADRGLRPDNSIKHREPHPEARLLLKFFKQPAFSQANFVFTKVRIFNNFSNHSADFLFLGYKKSCTGMVQDFAL